MKWLSYRLMRLFGWDFAGQLPDVPKMVIIGAPHTSNLDFFLFLGALHYFDMRVRFLGKHTLFRRPFGSIFRRFGGIPVDRSRAGGVVAQVKAEFEATDRMILVIAPEGTRSAARRWKSGFIEIASEANVPVVFAGVDGVRKTVVFGPPENVGADRGEFMDRVRAFYEDKSGLKTHGKGSILVRGEVARTSE